MPDTIELKSTIEEFVIFPRGGLVASGVRFVTSLHNISGSRRPEIGDQVEKKNILHTWWRAMTAEECRRLYEDGVTFDKITERLDVLRLG